VPRGPAARVARTPAAAGPAAPEQVAVGTRGGPGPEGV
jgi:hypothetical protein